ncbi:MAG: hypothetical protein J6L62_03410 [Clostridia bacterium]|nr:hypothetical protein [Clostridia bacterium]
MNYCTRCGKEYEGDPGFCPECGSINQSASDNRTEVFYAQNPYQQVPPQQPPYQQAPPYQQPPYQQAPPYQQPPYQQAPPYQQPPMEVDAPNTGFAILSFFFPMVGFVLWLVWKDKTPLKAKSCGKGALISVIINTVVSVLIVILYAVFIGVIVASETSAPIYY